MNLSDMVSGAVPKTGLYTRRALFGVAFAAAAGFTFLNVSSAEQLATTSEALAKVNQSGYEILNQKIRDPDSVNYVVILPEMHGYHQDSNRRVIADLTNNGVIKSIGLEGLIGDLGEDLIVSTSQFEGNNSWKWTNRTSPGNDYSTFDSVMDYATQKYIIPSFGLESSDSYIKTSVMNEVHDLSNDFFVSLFKDQGDEKLRQQLKLEMGRHGIEYDDSMLHDKRRMIDLIEKIAVAKHRARIIEGNNGFLSNIRPQSIAIVGLQHAPDLLQRYEGNGIVINPVQGTDKKSLDYANFLRGIYARVKEDPFVRLGESILTFLSTQ